MNTKYLIVGGLLVVLGASVVGAALYAGVGPVPGGGSGEEIEEFPTEEGTENGTDATFSDDAEPFSFTIDDIEECGGTCRDVTATLDNNRNETATGVTVYIRIFAGENNAETGDAVWEDTEAVGEMGAGGTHTTTKRVELSLQDGRKVDQNDGWITVLTTVESDDTTVTFQESRQVA